MSGIAAEPHVLIERLLQYAQVHLRLESADVVWARNALLDLFALDEPAPATLCEQWMGEVPEQVSDILEPLLDAAYRHGLLVDNTTTRRDLLDAKIMGLLMPRPSEVEARFWQIHQADSPAQATDDYYRMSQASNYIRMDRIASNEYWLADTAYGALEITINLSKPEKDPAEIAALKHVPSVGYPRCVLCLDNVGYAGRLNHPARQNHRVIGLPLDGEQWYLQYSPYVYYNEHCIVFSQSHTPMTIEPKTFARLLDYIEQFPHYFVGSNADLPIVGGSILNHEHYQGGRHRFAMEAAPCESVTVLPAFADCKIGRVKWPMSVLRISGVNRGQLQALAEHILQQWRAYSDPSANIYATSTQDDEVLRHNTITPIARYNKAGEYELDLVLRNNRTSDEHPEGIFHPHRELHHIKKENIGLIEVMGLAVLPGRLQEELALIAELLAASVGAGITERSTDDSAVSADLVKHLDWINDCLRSGLASGDVQANLTMLRGEVGQKFAQVLAHAGVFARDENGAQAFERFVAHLQTTSDQG